MKPEETLKDKNTIVRKLSDTADRLEKGEICFVYFETSETAGPSFSKGHFILQYQNFTSPCELEPKGRQAVAALRNLAEMLNQGATISVFREEFEPVKGVDYSSLAETQEYGGFQRLVVEWEK